MHMTVKPVSHFYRKQQAAVLERMSKTTREATSQTCLSSLTRELHVARPLSGILKKVGGWM